MASIQSTIALTDAFSAPMMGIVRAVQMGTAMMQQMQSTVEAPVDTASFDAIREALVEAERGAQKMNEQFKNISPPPPVEMSVVWQTDSLPVFTGTGTERFAQEIQSVNAQMNTLSLTQQRIAEAAARTGLFPPEAAADISAMQTRLADLRSRILAIENNPLDMGTDAASAQLEHMRGLLGAAESAQEALNRAVENMDVEAANRAYLQMSQTISGAQRYIRDNTAEQENFTRAVEQSGDSADRLFSVVRGLVGAYASIQTVGRALNLSDNLSQTTARLNLIADDGGSVEALEAKVMASAQRARASYFDTANVVASMGANARNAFATIAIIKISKSSWKRRTSADNPSRRQGLMLCR